MTNTETPTYEHHFVTLDKDADGNDVRFGLIEDESGGTFWGYGHVAASEFVAEVNRWIRHCGLADEELPNEAPTPVDHLWACVQDDNFRLIDHAEDASDPFPVTRLRL